MTRRVTPMIHVPDVRAAVEWYESIGFVLEETNEVDGDTDWAMLSFGAGSGAIAPARGAMQGELWASVPTDIGAAAAALVPGSHMSLPRPPVRYATCPAP